MWADSRRGPDPCQALSRGPVAGARRARLPRSARLALTAAAHPSGVCGGGRALVWLWPHVIFLAVFTYYPMGFSAYLSLFKWNVLNPEKVWIGLDNYLTLTTRWTAR